MSVLYLEPKENLKTSGFKVFGTTGAIWAATAQGVREPTEPAAKGGEFAEGESGGAQLATKYNSVAEGTSITAVVAKAYIGLGATASATWQYGYGGYGEHAAGFHSLSNGWNSLTVSGATLSITNSLWIEIKPGTSTYGLQVWDEYIMVETPAEGTMLRVIA